MLLKDCDDPNPLIRALAVRTMGCIRVDKITEYLCEPLRKCLKDEDPYVRKTAAVCVAKLHDINSQLVEDQGFLDQLKDLLSDSNPMVCLICTHRIMFRFLKNFRGKKFHRKFCDSKFCPRYLCHLVTQNLYLVNSSVKEKRGK